MVFTLGIATGEPGLPSIWGKWPGCLTWRSPKARTLRVPRFLVLRRKYEVNESMWLVKFGRPKVTMIMKWARGFTPIARSVQRGLVRQGQKTVLFIQWRRMPKEWELSFVSKMKSMESRGIAFPVILHTSLPSVIGDGPSEVLLRWVGSRARSQPKQFVEVVGKMFGPSGKRIITGLEGNLDPQETLGAQEEQEEPFQSLIDAIQLVDATKPNQLRPLQKDRWKHLSE